MRRLTASRTVLGLMLIVVIGLTIAWVARRPIADAAIRSAIETRGARASYTVKSIGLQWERIENLRIGDPKAPDLTADWADIRVSAGFDGVSLKAVRAGGVRIRGRIVDGNLDLGDVSKLLATEGARGPLSLPDLDVDLADVRLSIDSPWGQIGARIDGKGNLSNGFAGKVAAIAPSLRGPGCSGDRVTAYVDIAIRNRQPVLKGPIRANSARCAGLLIAGPAVNADISLGPSLTKWRGSAALKAAGIQNAEATLARIDGRIFFDGNVGETRGKTVLNATGGRYGSTRFLGLRVGGDFVSGKMTSGQGTVAIKRVMPDTRLLSEFDRALVITNGTPIGPLLNKLAGATRKAASGIAVSIDARFAGRSVNIPSFRATTAAGAVLQGTGGSGIRFGDAGFSGDMNLQLSGPGFPTIQASLNRRLDGMTQGVAKIAPFAADGARLVLAPVRFAANPNGAFRFETTATLDGPVEGGFITGLALPINATINADSAMIVNNGCTPVKFRALGVLDLKLEPTVMRLCPIEGGALFRRTNGRINGGAVIDAPRLTGTLGTTSLSIAGRSARIRLGTPDFAVDQMVATLGSGNQISRLELATIRGGFVGGDIRGRFGGAAGNIANVPILVDQGAGDWILRNGALSLQAGINVSDQQVPARFNSLRADNTKLRFANNQLTGTATLRTPANSIEVSTVNLVHNLSSQSGSAKLVVDDLRFGKSLQPEALTPLTLGIVANVDGSVSGFGTINWGPNGVTSSGRFSTAALDFAAAFGPVTDLAGTVVFDDLLALATPPGQRVTVGSINPGTLVTSGVINYQLLPNQRLVISDGSWPFAGGELLLDPATLDLATEAERKLTFRVVGLDAAKFIQQLEFENLAAAGTFDGVMPMYFDARGGRIEGGRLVVRQGGGTLAYVGEISNAAMNVYAKLAFDALKSIRYDRLTIDLNGPLDGEIVSQIYFNGINEAPLSPPKSFIARQFIGLPFVFNIKVKAPFRSLLNTARTIEDPTSLLQRTLPAIGKPPVQPPESEPKR